MGMYTQVRGWLNVDRIGFSKFEKLEKIFNDIIEEYRSEEHTPRQDIVIDDTIIHIGSNCSAFIFIGTELKNYDNDAEEWLKFLISKFPNAEGQICFQYEESNGYNTIWIVSNGNIVETYEHLPFKGYGNSSEDMGMYNLGK